MRELTPVEVLTILAQRLEKRAKVMESVRMPQYDMVAFELQGFAEMVRKARDYVAGSARARI